MIDRNYGIVAVAAIVALGGISCSRHGKDVSQEAVVAVDVAVPVIDSVMLYTDYPGYLEADATVDVVGRVNGQVRSVNFEAGSLVNRGQLLYTIEDTRYRDAVEQASAQLQTARSSYEYASSHYTALKKALQSDAVSQMEVNQGESAMLQAQDAIKNAEAQLQTARTNLGYCRVTAPRTGHITGTNINVGGYCGGEGAPVTLATIYDDARLNAVFSIDDSRFLQMIEQNTHGEKIDYARIPLKFSQELPHKYTADMSYLAPDIRLSTGTLEVKAKVGNPYGELKAGMYVTVSLPSGFEPHAILVRDASIGTDQQGKFLYVVNDSDKVVYTPVKVGALVRDSMRIVNSGISPQTRYVTKALLKVKDGMKVKPIMKR